LYRYDTSLVAVGFRVADAVTLVLGIPLLVLSTLLYRRGSLRGGLLLTGVLAYFLYTYGSMAFGAAYNNLFLVYVALFSASLYGLVFALTSFDLNVLPAHYSEELPRRGIGIFLAASGVILLLVWLGLSILPALLRGQAPAEVWSYTTVITYVIDLAIIVPALILAGVWLLRRAPIGYLAAATMVVFTALLGIALLAAGVAQVLGGLASVGQFVAFTVSFSILTLIALWLTAVLFRCVSDSTPVQAAQV
jgi:hypothetical protein